MWVPSATVRRRNGSVWLSRDERDLLKLPQSDPIGLAVLESFIFAQTVDAAFQRFSARRTAAARRQLMEVDGILDPAVNARILLEQRRLAVFLPRRRKVDVTRLSRDTGAVLEAMEGALGRTNKAFPTSRQMFDEVVTDLVGAGALSPKPGTVRFGDFGRLWPFSHRFGFDRGAPVDRYYLQQFVRSIRPVVRGRCLEIGGSLKNNWLYRFDVDEFRTLELEQSRVADDLVGDAADRGVLDPESWDSILAFHVLEHCPNPFAVASNMCAWLRPNGHACIVVPCAQRVHNYPGDYWRFMPDGLRVLFRDFSEVNVSTYGNPLTVVSNYLALSHTELLAEDMDAVHPDYPVLACVVARK